MKTVNRQRITFLLGFAALIMSAYNLYRVKVLTPTTYIFNVGVMPSHELRHFKDYVELEKFLEMDTTDLLEYRGDFKCLNFAEMLSYRAMENGYRVVVLEDAWEHNVTIRHAYCMAYCIEEDTFYVIEPQSDQIIYTWSYEGNETIKPT